MASPINARRVSGEFAQARALAERNDKITRGQAARTVAGQATDPVDCRRLLSMLGLDGVELAETESAATADE